MRESERERERERERVSERERKRGPQREKQKIECVRERGGEIEKMKSESERETERKTENRVSLDILPFFRTSNLTYSDSHFPYRIILRLIGKTSNVSLSVFHMKT